MLSADEPRYVAIGRAMARTGDFITPHLWNTPWFEKPPLLYWMSAAGFSAGLNPELAGRLPVALLSLAFLAVAFVLLRHEFGPQAAAISVALLATSAGWLAYSSFSLTDLPLAVFFSIAVFLALPLLRSHADTRALGWRFAAIGASLGFAALAKGLVPLALSLPLAWFLRRFWRAWWVAALAFAIVAGPWYAAVYARNGYPFLAEFFVRHHFERLYSPSLQHVQPWYYYFPIAIAGLLPWTPLFALLARSHPIALESSALLKNPVDQRRRFLAAVFCFGFLVFTLSLNKLPGYLLPLFPSAFALLGARFEAQHSTGIPRIWLYFCALLIGGIPLLTPVLTRSLAAGRFSFAGLRSPTRIEFFYVALPLAVVVLARRSWTGLLLILCVVSGGIYMKATAYPILDREVSARGLWEQLRSVSGELCNGGMSLAWLYGLSFYRGALLEPCHPGADSQIKLRSQDHEKPIALYPEHKKAGQP